MSPWLLRCAIVGKAVCSRPLFILQAEAAAVVCSRPQDHNDEFNKNRVQDNLDDSAVESTTPRASRVKLEVSHSPEMSHRLLAPPGGGNFGRIQHWAWGAAREPEPATDSTCEHCCSRGSAHSANHNRPPSACPNGWPPGGLKTFAFGCHSGNLAVP